MIYKFKTRADGDLIMTAPVVVASCDRATFNEFLRPLFADD